MPTIDLDGHNVEYEVRHSARATRARIDAGPDELAVVIPETMDLDPKTVLENNRDWVLKKRREYEAYRERIPDYTFEEGAEIPYLGTPHEIEVRNGDQPEIVDEVIILQKDRVDSESVRKCIEQLFRTRAREKIKDIIDDYAPDIDGSHDQIYIKDQKTRWGSCSKNDNLSFNWRLIMAPPCVLEYVVAHELTHLEHRNHNEEFWIRLRELYPEYEQGMNWLKENNHELVFL